MEGLEVSLLAVALLAVVVLAVLVVANGDADGSSGLQEGEVNIDGEEEKRELAVVDPLPRATATGSTLRVPASKTKVCSLRTLAVVAAETPTSAAAAAAAVEVAVEVAVVSEAVAMVSRPTHFSAVKDDVLRWLDSSRPTSPVTVSGTTTDDDGSDSVRGAVMLACTSGGQPFWP
jgi:hypothetical protein